MPGTNVYFYREQDGSVPVLGWMDGIPEGARDKIFYRIRRLEQMGHELRRPEVDFLRDGIMELRIRRQRVNYRVLYFFHRHEAVLALGCTKGAAVENADIDRALERKRNYANNAKAHRYVSEPESQIED